MQQYVKYLVVEDNPAWSKGISAEVRNYFENVCQLYKLRISSLSAYDGDQGNEQLSNNTFDLVTLDMNLGEGAGKSKISGLDLLGEIAAGNRAFFVIIITGAVNDPDLERIYGKEEAALMRFGAMNEAVRQLPAERVRILHKPNLKDPAKAVEQLAPHLHSALDQYRAVSRERNIFRPFPGSNSLWEVRYNGGARLTIPASDTFELIRSALAHPNREMKVIQLIQAIAHSSGKTSAASLAKSSPSVMPKNVGDATGLDWEDADEFSTPDHFPVDTIEGTIPLETLVGALLMANRQGLSLEKVLDQFCAEYGPGPLLMIPGKIREYASRPLKAEEEFQFEKASDALSALAKDMEPFMVKIRKRADAESSQPKGKNKGRVRVALGRDTREMQLARAHWKRARAYLVRHQPLAPFVAHIENCVERGLTSKGHIHYSPANGSEFCPYWLTD